ncbi:regulatory inactivation of DnaA Hda protein [Thiogranum longum]|uniref:Regulatory inactivation of DnaA Hda protein n=1 Tax=Thiogranum longum TaxID=1537524 RepID=A0A4V2PGR6_9GAMM|nr:DnaA regulatory inactivator Hda [Thiogranum longum]TCK17836.1 regulatory inactivation of DnaA Hda protein [Thiogranum longum]
MSRQLALELQLRASARFSSFVAGPNAELLRELQRLAVCEGESFMFCRGARGSGKTHLLQACCHAATEHGCTAAYLSLNDIDTIPPEILEGWEQFELVCLDDIENIAGRPDWEEGVFHFYNRVREQGGRLLVSASCAPAQLDITLADLQSRLSWGVVYPIHALDDEQRCAAMQLRAKQKGCELPDETAVYLLRRLPRELPALFDTLDRLDEASLAAQRKLTVPFVKSVLQSER